MEDVIYGSRLRSIGEVRVYILYKMSGLEVSEMTGDRKVEFSREMVKSRENTLTVKIFECGEAKSFPQGKGIVKPGRDKKMVIADRSQMREVR